METLKKEGLLSMDKSYDNESFGIDEFSFSKRMQNEDINDKLQALFAKNEDEDLEEDVETIKNKIDDAYKTANEEITTDTPLTSEAEGAQEMRASEESESAANVASAKANKILKQQAGIVSSDEENQEEESEVGIESSQSSQEEEEDKAEPLQAAQSEPVEEVAADNDTASLNEGIRSIYDDEKQKEVLQH